MTDPGPDDVIVPGSEVRDTDGVLLGQVDEVTPGYLVVDRSETGAPTLYVPAEDVEAAVGLEVTLDVSATDLATLGWESAPADLHDGEESGPEPATPEEVAEAVAREASPPET